MVFIRKILRKYWFFISISTLLFYIFTYQGYNFEILHSGTYMISLIIYTFALISFLIFKYFKKDKNTFNIKIFLSTQTIILILLLFLQILFGNSNDWMTFSIYFIIFLLSQIILSTTYLILQTLKNKNKNKS